eukprot:CAMPEP_0115460866 /NCGR_PEP_ID=MMETSP0271-20121206/47012_1 /TAXON_ID=71861 /ORGANISM="Scrippsiella trochoidea, Strain CCMP3099" /LENGTH=183 /DNA_ID=CAMNT_0002887601 /DNA_START=328 /DNA_END=881 /DNA_ORIENTATION=-
MISRHLPDPASQRQNPSMGLRFKQAEPSAFIPATHGHVPKYLRATQEEEAANALRIAIAYGVEQDLCCLSNASRHLAEHVEHGVNTPRQHGECGDPLVLVRDCVPELGCRGLHRPEESDIVCAKDYCTEDVGRNLHRRDHRPNKCASNADGVQEDDDAVSALLAPDSMHNPNKKNSVAQSQSK